MKKIILLTVFLFPFINSYAEDCFCAGAPTFCEAVTNDNNDIVADVIFRGTYLGADEFQIDHILHGDMIQNKITIIYTLCDVTAYPLKVNEPFIVAAQKIDSAYFYMFCSISYLKIENEVVNGPIAPGIESIEYLDFNTLNGCSEQFDVIDIFTVEDGVFVYPNPVRNILRIKNINPFSNNKNVRIEFFDMTGRKLYTFIKEDELFGDETWSINLKSFTAGVYFLKVTADNQEQMIKIFKKQ